MNLQPNKFLLLFFKYKTLLLFILAAILLFTGLGASTIYILDEARNAQAAREMMQHNEWVVPTFNGELRAHKPPLHYYFMQVAYRAVGVSAFSARFFSAVMGLLTIWITWFFSKRFINTATANWSVIVLLLSTHFLFEFRLAVPDPYLIFFITAGILCFYAFLKENKTAWLIASAISLGLAILSKGPVALALPGLIILWWLLSQKKYQLLFSWKMILYGLTIALIAVPWYVSVHYATDGEFTNEFFLRHNVSRFGEAMEGHGGFFLLIPLFVFIGFIPFVVFIVEMLKQWRKYYKENTLTRLCIQTTTVFIVFFSLSGTKLPNYPMPCYPFLAILFGYWINEQIRIGQTIKRYPFIFLLTLNVLLYVAAAVGLNIETATRTFSGWAGIFIIPIITTYIAFWQLKKKGLRKSLGFIVTGHIIFNFLFLSVAYPSIYSHNPVTKTINLLPKNEQVYAYKIYNPAYNFHLNKPIIVLNNRREIEKLLSLQTKVKIISREGYLNELRDVPLQVVAKERDLFETATTIILQSK